MINCNKGMQTIASLYIPTFGYNIDIWTPNINRVHPMVIVNLSVKFYEYVTGSLASIV